jgi:hypothetical protein
LLDEETVGDILNLELRAMEISYPVTNKEVLQSFVRDNMIEIFPYLIEANTPRGKK